MDNSLVWLSKQTLQAQEDGLDGVRSSPLILQDIQADTAREINVGVVDRCLEDDGGSAVWVGGWEGEGELEGKSSIWSLVRALDRSGP